MTHLLLGAQLTAFHLIHHEEKVGFPQITSQPVSTYDESDEEVSGRFNHFGGKLNALS